MPTGTATRPIAAEPDTGPVTDVTLTPGNTGDAEVAAALVDGEPAGTEVRGDSAYGTAEFRHDLSQRNMTATIKPPPLRAAVAGGFTSMTSPSTLRRAP
jgi:IS5 family transposase